MIGEIRQNFTEASASVGLILATALLIASFMEDVNKRRRISFSLSAVLKKSTPGKFAYTCHFQQIGINATKIEKTGIHFKTDVFAAVAVVDAKAP